MKDDGRVITMAESRTVLAEIGIDGEILRTPGHPSDSASLLLLDPGAVFTGDLTHHDGGAGRREPRRRA